ncbi:MAG: dihydrofolate synthase/folylpolyglutamate synthase [Planctomycetota bacterium]|jgi:dihydrofolate synthase/folylpolyglutamate synthase
MVRDPQPLSPRLAAAVQRLDARIDWEKRRRRDVMRVDVGPARDLLDRAGAPDRKLRVIHFAGTKGKGSCALRVAEGLTNAGRSVGIFASPHVERVTERVRLGREEIGDDALAGGLERALELQQAAEAEDTPGGRASWFDLITVGAILCMAQAGVEWALLEVGLGGRLDSTNAADGELAVITSIDLEHTEILGSTRSAIAGEKAGVLRAGRPFVCGVAQRPELSGLEDAWSVLDGRARELGCALHWVAPEVTVAATNRAIAAEVLNVLGAAGELDQERRPMAGSLLAEGPGWRLPGRLERFHCGEVPVVIDGAHVASSVERLLQDLARDESLSGPCVVVLALAGDKPTGSLLKTLVAKVDSCICTSVASGIHRDADDLAALAAQVGLDALAVSHPGDAVAEACTRVASGGWVLVTGSLYLAGAVRKDLSPDADPA